MSDDGVKDFTYSLDKDWINIFLFVSVAERLLDTKYHVFRHEDHGELAIRTLEWSLSNHLHDHIGTIQPTNYFFSLKANHVRAQRVAAGTVEKKDRIPTYDELAKEDMIEMGNIDISDIKDLPSNPTVAQACNRLAISPLCLRMLYGTLDYLCSKGTRNESDFDIFFKNITTRCGRLGRCLQLQNRNHSRRR